MLGKKGRLLARLTRHAPHDARLLAPDGAGIARAVEELAAGGVVAVPTETVYGLAGDATSSAAVAAIYAKKGRPAVNPLIVHVTDLAMAERYADIPPVAEELAAAFWPGPLTMVLKAHPGEVAPQVTAGLATVAVRMPRHPVMRAVIAGLGRGVAAPSANRSGRLSPTDARHVLQSFGAEAPLVLDGGRTDAGVESTIVAAGDGRVHLLRKGALPVERLARVLGYVPAFSVGEKISAPGQILRHYAPRLPLRLNATAPKRGEIYIGFGAFKGHLTLSDHGNLEEAAHNLFAMLYEAEQSRAHGIAIAPIPETGIGCAINDRLMHAAQSAGRAV